MIYTLANDLRNKKDLTKALNDNPNIKFVSLAGVDWIGHETEEKIPVRVFLEDLDLFLEGIPVQTDGSSVYLPKIATLDNAKIDMKPDLNVNWFVDYNFDYLDKDNGKPTGTLKIPCFLYHDNRAVDSRSILTKAQKEFEKEVQEMSKIIDDDIKSVNVTAATELEFWVRSPEEERELEELSTSQELNEQYWAKTRGPVRSALEETLQLMELYGFEPEMGHKEVGGVKARLHSDGSFSGIMEQLEIDWKYSNAIQAADNEIFIKNLIKETFRRRGMDVTFLAKPIPKVAGSGEHTHIGVVAKLKDNSYKNLFHSGESYLSVIGYGALMGLLKNYEVINPFITSSNEAFKRLKKGFEAPVCTVASLGRSVSQPSRNRSILVGLIRDNNNPLATRFELRSPNPHTNTYLCVAAMLMGMLDGIVYSVKSNKSEKELFIELSKANGVEVDYLEKERAYISEENIFEDFTDEELERLFGEVPSTVYENISALWSFKDKAAVLNRHSVFEDYHIESYISSIVNKWATEINHRIIPAWRKEVKSINLKLDENSLNKLDKERLEKLRELKRIVLKDEIEEASMLTKLYQAVCNNDYEKASQLQKETFEIITELRELYIEFSRNI